MPIILEFELGTMAVAGLVIHAQKHCRRINVERSEDRTAIRADGRGDIVFRLFIPEGPVIRIVDIHDLRRVVGQRFRTRSRRLRLIFLHVQQPYPHYQQPY